MGYLNAFWKSDNELEVIFRIDLASGDRTIVSGCSDPFCPSSVGSGPDLTSPIDLLVIPEPTPGLAGTLALGIVAAIALLRPAERTASSFPSPLPRQ